MANLDDFLELFKQNSNWLQDKLKEEARSASDEDRRKILYGISSVALLDIEPYIGVREEDIIAATRIRDDLLCKYDPERWIHEDTVAAKAITEMIGYPI